MLLSVEIAQLSTNMKTVLEVKSGTKLPAAEIFSLKIILLLDGQKIGYGEVLRIGNTWGIQVTELGKISTHSQQSED